VELVEISQNLFDEVTTNLISLYKVLTNEMDMHLDERLKKMKAKRRVMALEKSLKERKQLDLASIAGKLREKTKEGNLRLGSRSIINYDYDDGD
jgi:potassium voltage-gated channel Shaker-related subfamily A protein 2